MNAILLLGPTGSGKTPLGEYLERHGLWNRRCAHFDFGAQLRSAATSKPVELSDADLAVITTSLKTGALLEDHQFPIAERILRAFVRTQRLGAEDWIILNGLPRHVGQARDVDRIVDVKAVVSLECSPETVRERIRLDSGGDRAGRIDDDLPAVARKLTLFAQRTRPLIDHYAARGVRIHPIPVGVRTSAEDVWRELSGHPAV